MRRVVSIKRTQRGLAMVEFAIVGALAIMMVFAVLEIARAVFVANALTEATRRGARMAVVCPINDPAIAEAATFNAPGAGSSSPIVRNLDTSDFNIEYLDRDGNLIASPDDAFALIRFIEVSVVNFEHELLIPFANVTFTMPGFTTTLPRESLGVPRSGVVTPC